MGFPIMQAVRRDGRVVECTGLENRQGFIAPLGFKSLSLHHLIKIIMSTLLLVVYALSERWQSGRMHRS